MNPRMKLLIGIVPFSALLMAAAWAADPPAAPVRSGQPTSADSDQEASCLLKIMADPAVFPLEPTILQYLLASSGVQQDAVKEVLGENAEVTVTLELMGGGGVSSPAGPRGGGGGMGGGPMRPGMMGAGGRGGMPGGFGGGMVGGMGGMGGGAPAAPIELPQTTEQMLMGHLHVQSERGHAREIMKSITERFQAALEKVGADDKGRLEQELTAVAKQADEARQRVNELQQVRLEMLGASPINDLSRESVLEMSRKFETERQDAAVRIESQRARNEALRKLLAEAAEQADQHAQQRRALTAKAQDLRSRLEELQRVRERPDGPPGPLGRSPAAQAEQAKAQAEQAKAQAEEMRHAAGALAELEGSLAELQPVATMRELNNQTGQLSVDLAEAEARMRVLEVKCKEMRELLAKADDFELRVGLELPLAKAAYESLRARQRELEFRASAIHPPTVSVIGG